MHREARFTEFSWLDPPKTFPMEGSRLNAESIPRQEGQESKMRIYLLKGYYALKGRAGGSGE